MLISTRTVLPGLLLPLLLSLRQAFAVSPEDAESIPTSLPTAGECTIITAHRIKGTSRTKPSERGLH